MKRRLTVTLDADLLLVARRYARSRGVSLSSLVEQSLRDIDGQGLPPFSVRWRGKFRAADRAANPRFDALAEKHLR